MRVRGPLQREQRIECVSRVMAEMLEGRVLLSSPGIIAGDGFQGSVGSPSLFVFFDDFDDGNAQGWTAMNQSGTRPNVVASPAGYALRGVGQGDGGPFTDRLVHRLPLVNATEISVEMRAKAGPGAGNVAEAFLLAGTSVEQGTHYWLWDRGGSEMTADWIAGNYEYVYNYEMGEMAYEWHDYRWWRDAQGSWSFSIDGEVKANRFRGDSQWTSFENLVLGVSRDQSEIEWVRVTAVADPPTPAEPIEMPGTGHYYQRVDAASLAAPANWPNARDQAMAMTYRGMKGHLATITSAQETEFIQQNVVNYSPNSDAGSRYWIGGSQAADGAEPDGGWSWVTGEKWSYTNWSTDEGQPDNGTRTLGYDEDALLICGVGEASYWGKWQDLAGWDQGVDGYLVEYEPATVEPTVHVLSPNGGETWTAGDSRTITWEYTGDSGAGFRIEYSKDGGSHWLMLGNTNGTTQFSFTVPADAVSDQVLLKVTATAGSSVVADVSDSSFKVKAAPNVIIVDGQTLTLTASKSVESVTITKGALVMSAGGGKVLSTGTLSIDDSGMLDVNDNGLIVKGGGVDAVVELVRSGCHGGAWDGSGITSTAAKNRPGGYTGLAAVLNNQGDGTLIVGSLNSVTVAVSDIVVKLTWNGDANLDGIVNADDYFLIDSGYVTQKKGWYNGDFNYDGTVNADDYFMIDSAFVGQVGALAKGERVFAATPMIFRQEERLLEGILAGQ